jgi:hypothetical protein
MEIQVISSAEVRNYTAAKRDFGIVLALSFYLIKISITSTQIVSQVSGLEKFKSLFLASENIIYKKAKTIAIKSARV